MTVDKQLKKKISARWKILAGAQGDAQEAAAYAQLEYILQEAGLLAKPRKKRHQFGKISPKAAATLASRYEADSRVEENDDNSIGLSEEVGRNYSE